MAFSDVKFLGQYDLKLPDFLASWDVWEYWERERIDSMARNLKRSDVLFEIGAESGWMTALFAKYFVAPQNMCIFEPTPEYWPNIKQTWEANVGTAQLNVPRGTLCALVGAEDKNHPLCNYDQWPTQAYGELSPARSYKYIHEHGDNVPQQTVDNFVAYGGTRAVPNALTIDVEGAELSVLQGARETLSKHHPLVWCSVHPDLMARDYGTTPHQLHEFMEDLGYVVNHLATDHEQHFLYAKAD